jgi:hypothetical protein
VSLFDLARRLCITAPTILNEYIRTKPCTGEAAQNWSIVTFNNQVSIISIPSGLCISIFPLDEVVFPTCDFNNNVWEATTHCYNFLSNTVTYSTAQNICQSQGGKLSPIYSNDEYDFLNEIAYWNYFWLPLSVQFDDEFWTWEGENLDVSFWPDWYPTLFAISYPLSYTPPCAYQDWYGWDVQDCSVLTSFMCKIWNPSTQVYTQGSCSYVGVAYPAPDIYTANQYCHSLGGNLATVSIDNLVAIINGTSLDPTQYYWIGAYETMGYH